MQRGSRWGRLLAAAAALAVGLGIGAMPPTARAVGEPMPVLTPVEMRELGWQPDLPGTAVITAAPAITGHAGADARIQQLAFARGYRLRSVPTRPLTSADGQAVQPETAAAWRALQAEAAAHGHRLVIRSGYRSIDRQRQIFLGKLGGVSSATIAAGGADGRIEAALRFNSIPGTSKHHTGHTVDIAAGGGTIGGFEATAAYRWISADNFAAAKRHGFLPSYPAGGGLQGPDPEPWELVWVGTSTIRCAASYVALTTPAPEGHCPIGRLDAVVDDGQSIRASGWALDRDVPGPIEIHLYVDGALVQVVRADGPRPDVAAAMGTDAAHGFTTVVPIAGGRHVCAYGINDRVGGVNTSLGCRSVVTSDVAPVGTIDVAVRDGGTAFVGGWAADPDLGRAAVPVHLYVDGRGAAILHADRPRPDVHALTGLGPNHGYAARIPLAPGSHEVCAYALGDRPGVNPQIGCRTIP